MEHITLSEPQILMLKSALEHFDFDAFMERNKWIKWEGKESTYENELIDMEMELHFLNVRLKDE